MKMFFATLALFIGFLSGANAQVICMGANGTVQRPVAIADNSGSAILHMTTGQAYRVTGLTPGQFICHQPVCTKPDGREFPPAAIANSDGIATVPSLSGKPFHVRGFEPGQEMCRNLIFRSAERQCPGGNARLAETRADRFCGGYSNEECVHIVCIPTR